MDMAEFKKEYGSKYDDCDTDLSFLKRLAVVRFEKDSRGYVSGKSGFGIVYRHRDHEGLIKEGETWICELTENPSRERQYFAKGLEKVDASFIFDLKQENMKILADTMWDDHRTYFESMFDERYSEIVEQKAQEMAKEIAVSEISKNQALEAEVESLKEKCLGLARDLADRDSYIEKLRVQRVQPLSRNVNYPVRRMTADTLYSEGFNGRYDVRFSANGKKMLIIPDEKGRIESVDRTIVLSGLNDIAPFVMSEILMSDCGKDGRLLVSLV